MCVFATELKALATKNDCSVALPGLPSTPVGVKMCVWVCFFSVPLEKRVFLGWNVTVAGRSMPTNEPSDSSATRAWSSLKVRRSPLIVRLALEVYEDFWSVCC